MLTRVRMTLEYDGTDFAGWQVQRSGRTVQGVLERALLDLCGREIRVTGSGRTDAGVHARGQVAHVDLLEDELPRVLSGFPEVLPEDVCARGLEVAPPGFHARFSAVRRTYSYGILRGRSPLLSRYAWELPWAGLDEGAMSVAASLSIGRNEWRGMSREGSGNRTWTVEVFDASIETGPGGWTLRITADRFLRGMVRIWAGTLVETGRGRFEPGRVSRILGTGDRTAAGPSLPAKGLVLESVAYGGG